MTSRRSFFAQAGLGLATLSGASSLLSGCATSAACSGASVKKAYGVPGVDYTTGNVPFHVGIAGFTFHKFKLDETLQMMKRVDVRYLCIKDFHLPLKSTPEQIAAFHEKCKKFNVTGYAVGPIYMQSEEQAKDAFEYAKRVGVKTVVGVPVEMRKVNGKNERFGSRKLLVYIEKLCKEFDMRYAIHNHGPDMPNLFPTAENGWELIKDLDPRVGFCLDIGHQYRAGYDPVSAIYAYPDRIHDVHLKNVSENTRRGGAMPLPRGKIDLSAVVKALCKIGYTGVCSLEYERDMSDPLLGIAESIGYFRGLMDSVR